MPEGCQEDFFADDDDTSNAAHQDAFSFSLVESLSQKCLASLARLACAFAPPGHGIHLQDLETVNVLSVDETHIEINAVLCEAQGCVTVAVPVTFPHPCTLEGDADNVTQCILDNIDELDHQAEGMLAELEWKETHFEEIQDHLRIHLALVDNDVMEHPSWWVFPNDSPGMVGECQSVRELLNEADFQTEIKLLATQLIQDSEEEYLVEQAGIAEVGAAGIILRAYVKQFRLDEEEDETKIVEIPFKFGEVATTVDDLRASVLGIIASCCLEE